MTDREIVNCEALLHRFVKDANLPINIFKQPYFTERLETLDPFYNSFESWINFVNCLADFDSEEDYFKYYNKLKDAIISEIQNQYPNFTIYLEFLDSIRMLGHGRNLWSPQNDGKYFVSVDLKKANFTALRAYSPAIFDFASSWEDFIGRYTDYEFLKRSKYVRQVILGARNPKMQVKLATRLINDVTEFFPDDIKNKIYSIESDELIIACDSKEDAESVLEVITHSISNYVEQSESLHGKLEDYFHVTGFQLCYQYGGYIKKQFNGETVLKCFDPDTVHLVVKKLADLPLNDLDYILPYKGGLVKMINPEDFLKSSTTSEQFSQS